MHLLCNLFLFKLPLALGLISWSGKKYRVIFFSSSFFFMIINYFFSDYSFYFFNDRVPIVSFSLVSRIQLWHKCKTFFSSFFFSCISHFLGDFKCGIRFVDTSLANHLSNSLLGIFFFEEYNRHKETSDLRRGWEMLRKSEKSRTNYPTRNVLGTSMSFCYNLLAHYIISR